MKSLTVKPVSHLAEHEFTPAQLDLIKATVAKNATDDELKLFLYRARHMGLDPLKSGQIHFVKYRDYPGSIVVGIDGFRLKAGQTGKHVGTRRGVIRDEGGKVIGGWCEVFRSDWSHPAREEVPLAEYYKPGKSDRPSNWDKMPETMIKKVAEAAALRMAFPDELGGVYSEEEMHQAEPKVIEPPIEEGSHFEEIDVALTAEPQEPGPGDYVIKAGQNKGKKLKDLTVKQIEGFLMWFDDRQRAGETMHPLVIEYAVAARAYLEVAE